MHVIVFQSAIIWLTLLLAVMVIQILRVRSMIARILVLDTLTMLLITLLILFALTNLVPYYLDAAISLALLTFIGTLAAARYYHDRRPLS